MANLETSTPSHTACSVAQDPYRRSMCEVPLPEIVASGIHHCLQKQKPVYHGRVTELHEVCPEAVESVILQRVPPTWLTQNNPKHT